MFFWSFYVLSGVQTGSKAGSVPVNSFTCLQILRSWRKTPPLSPKKGQPAEQNPTTPRKKEQYPRHGPLTSTSHGVTFCPPSPPSAPFPVCARPSAPSSACTLTSAEFSWATASAEGGGHCCGVPGVAASEGSTSNTTSSSCWLMRNFCCVGCMGRGMGREMSYRGFRLRGKRVYRYNGGGIRRTNQHTYLGH